MVICVIACLAVGVGWQATASAGGDHPGRYGPHGPVITTSSSTADPGDSLTVNCKNFAPNEKITFTLHSGGAVPRQDALEQERFVLHRGDDSVEHDSGRTHDRRHWCNRRLGVHGDHRCDQASQASRQWEPSLVGHLLARTSGTTSGMVERVFENRINSQTLPCWPDTSMRPWAQGAPTCGGSPGSSGRHRVEFHRNRAPKWLGSSPCTCSCQPVGNAHA